MTSFNKLEMASTILALSCINISKYFFGLCRKVTYIPSQSPVKAIQQEYSPDMGELILRTMKLPIDKWANEFYVKGKPQPTAIGKYRLEACVSDDRQFCALQLLSFGDTYYDPVTDILICEGKEAELAAAIL